MITATEKRTFILDAVSYLGELDAYYKQNIICKKLRVLGYNVSASALSRLKRDNYGGANVLTNLSEGLTELLIQELGVVYHQASGTFKFDRPDNWVPKPVQLPPELLIPDDQRNIRLYGSGRRSVADKTAFMSSAREEVIIVGSRLRQLSGYFSGRSDAEFSDHVKSLLQKGVNFNCYMLDPIAPTTATYYEDLHSVSDAKKAIAELHQLKSTLENKARELNGEGWPGTFSIHTYAHLPSGYFMAVDGEKLMTAAYLFGQDKRNVPVMELHMEEDKAVFLLYFQAMMKLIGR